MPTVGQYEYIIDFNHPNAFSDGRVFVHVFVASNILGRGLLEDEVVHHKDKNKKNNNPDNIIVFATRADHTRFHSLECDDKYLILNENGSYSCKNNQARCIECGQIITHKATRCEDCSYIAKRKVVRPSSDTLYNDLLLSNGNFTYVGKKYGVSDNTIRKWCLKYDLPVRSSDY